MKRPLFILLGAFVLGAAIFAGAYFTCQYNCLARRNQSADDLAWLRLEFHLSDAEMAHIRTLHEGYLPQCAAMCARIAAKKQELESAQTSPTNTAAGARAGLQELARLRAQCRAQMIQYFARVSQAMPPEQGRRYLAEMQQLASVTQEQMEQSMSGHAPHESAP
jgi:hypothetical protein